MVESSPLAAVLLGIGRGLILFTFRVLLATNYRGAAERYVTFLDNIRGSGPAPLLRFRRMVLEEVRWRRFVRGQRMSGVVLAGFGIALFVGGAINV